MSDTVRGVVLSTDAAQSFGSGCSAAGSSRQPTYPMQLSASSRANKENIVREGCEGEWCSEGCVEKWLNAQVAAACDGLKVSDYLRRGNGPGSGAQRADPLKHAMADKGADIHAILIWAGIATGPQSSAS